MGRNPDSAARPRTRSSRHRGFTLIELLVVILLVGILTAIAIPQVQGALNSYRLNAAVSSMTWAIQTTRYQAIMHGYPYQVAFNASTNTYQVLNEAPGTAAFAALGNPVPIANALMVINQNTTLQFSPNGSVTAALGAMNFTVTSSQGGSHTVTVSNYGSITVQ